MELNQYQYMFEAEDHHWWYVGNHEIFLDLLQRKGLLIDGCRLLDAGCGTGKWLQILTTTAKVKETGIDYQAAALQYARTRGAMNLSQADLNTCSFEEGSFDLITSFDVICNTNINDHLVTGKFHTWLKQDGHLLLTVPAYRFLLGKHDQLVHQNKRYTRKKVRTLLKQQGFEIIKLTYCVHLLFPAALIKRLLGRLTEKKEAEHNEVQVPGALINRTFLAIMRFEKILLRFFSLPFGLSVMVLARKKVPSQGEPLL